MGDRCYFEITLRTRDVKKAGEAFSPGWNQDEWWSDVNDGDPYATGPDAEPSVSLAVEEINYGGQDEIDALAALGIPFHGYHTAGCGYSAEMFACDGETLSQHVCFNDGSELGVPVDTETGRPDAQALNAVAAFVRHLKNARESVEKGHKQG